MIRGDLVLHDGREMVATRSIFLGGEAFVDSIIIMGHYLKVEAQRKPSTAAACKRMLPFENVREECLR